MSEPGWDNEAWSQIKDYELFWKPFDAQFHFRPGMRAETWPAIAAEDVALVALDWQHPSYWFWPHRQEATVNTGGYRRFLTATTSSS